MSTSDNYGVVTSAMNVNNFIRYNITQIFTDNWDWPGNNIKYWRSRAPNERWRWILFDADFSFGLFTPDGYAHNMLQFATNPNGPSPTIWGWDPWWPNPPWSTILLRTLLEFLNQFLKFAHEKFLDFLESLIFKIVVRSSLSFPLTSISARSPSPSVKPNVIR